METNKEMLIEHCTDILHGKDQLCVLVSVSNTGYPITSVVRPAGGIGIETIYFILYNNSAIVTSFENNPRGNVTFYGGDNSVSLIGEVFVISSETLCKDGVDTHFYSTDVRAEYVLLKFVVNEAYIHIDGEYQTIQI